MLPWYACPITVLDTETTGVGPDARVVEIAVVTVDRWRVTSEWSSLVDPGVPVPASASRVHGIADAALRGAPTLPDVWSRVLRAARHAVLAAYGAAFDRRVLAAECARLGLAPLPDRGWIDPLVWARAEFHGNDCTLGTVAARLGIRAPELHRAGSDARLAYEIMARLRPAVVDAVGACSIGEFLAAQERVDQIFRARPRRRPVSRPSVGPATR